MTPGTAAVLTLLGALALDLAFGDPPNRWHPVAWIGAAIAGGRRRLAHGGRVRLFVAGALVTLGVSVLAATLAWLLVRAAAPFGAVGLVVEATALKSLLSFRGLAQAARSVAEHLSAGELSAARREVAEHLVSRPTGELAAPQVASAAIESVAENLTDSLVGPVACYLVFGLPGAAVYRVINTADAMLGYRDGPLEYFGKLAARLDDVLNLIPARLAACALVVAAGLAGGSTRTALAAMRRDARRTASPNAGWTMSAMAGALGVVLEKPGAYVLGTGRPPAAADIDRSVRITATAAALTLGVLGLARFAAGFVPR